MINVLGSLPKVKKIYAKIWNTEKLITSMDIMIGYRPWYKHEGISCPIVEGLHRDQAPHKAGFHCVQGMLILKDFHIRTNVLNNQPRRIWLLLGRAGSQCPDSVFTHIDKTDTE